MAAISGLSGTCVMPGTGVSGSSSAASSRPARRRPGEFLRRASLRAPDLRRWPIARNELIGAPPGFYPETARWAAAIPSGVSGHRGAGLDLQPV